MWIRSINLMNFRCFDDLHIEFDQHYTLIVGNNGVGKSTILDAVAIALGAYVSGFDGIRAASIIPEDARLLAHEFEHRIDVQPQFPVRIEANGEIESNNLSWALALNAAKCRTTHGEIKSIKAYAAKLQNDIRLTNPSCSLPLIAYYSTARLWMKKREKTQKTQTNETIQRQTGYMDCLDIASNEKFMMRWFEEMTYIELQEGVKLPELDAIKHAMAMAYRPSEFGDKTIDVRYSVKKHCIEILVKDGDEVLSCLPIHAMSDGEKGVLLLVADMAYRMAILNPHKKTDVLNTPGIVLIDEIDLHLHPKWQKTIVHDLITIFPNVQFILTTHAPAILANIHVEHLRILKDNKIHSALSKTYGRPIDAILREIMEINVRPQDVEQLWSQFYIAMDNEKYDEAARTLHELNHILGDNDGDVVQANTRLYFECQDDKS